MRILCTGDVHIGRRSTRLPAHLDAHAHSCAVAWGRIVERAISEKVDALCVAGDLVDRSNRYLEAIGPLEQGLARLTAAGIDTIVVAGNHDHDVLPALIEATQSPRVRLLGGGGRWERLALERNGATLHVDGWSFPQTHYPSSPIRDYRLESVEGPSLGLVHADLDDPVSRYAPVEVAELRRFPRTLFVVGHIHTARIVREAGGAQYLYPGSPQPIDRGETGRHGVTLIELERGEWRAREIPLATVRYEPLVVDVEGVTRLEEVDARIGRAAREALEQVVDEVECLICVRFRLKLVGRTSLSREIESRVADLAADLELVQGEVTGTIESWWSALRPAHDLEAIARGIGAPAVLAGILTGESIAERLKHQIGRLVQEVHGSRSFAEVSGGQEDLEEMEAAAEEELRRAATILLDELMSKRVAS